MQFPFVINLETLTTSPSIENMYKIRSIICKKIHLTQNIKDLAALILAGTPLSFYIGSGLIEKIFEAALKHSADHVYQKPLSIFFGISGCFLLGNVVFLSLCHYCPSIDNFFSDTHYQNLCNFSFWYNPIKKPTIIIDQQ